MKENRINLQAETTGLQVYEDNARSASGDEMSGWTQKVFRYNDNPVTFGTGGVTMVNATEMAKPFGKRPVDWLRYQQAQDFISILAKVRKNTSADLVRVIKGGNGMQGTWMHEDVALEFARWLSPMFGIWCNDRIKELMRTGTTTIDEAIAEMPGDCELLITIASRIKGYRDEISELRKTIDNQYELLVSQSEENRMMNKIIEEMTSKVRFCDDMLQSTSTVSTAQIAADYGMSARKFNKLLHDMKIQHKVGDQWILYAPYNTMGYTRSVTIVPVNSPTGRVVMSTRWRQSGRRFLYDKLKEAGILPKAEME